MVQWGDGYGAGEHFRPRPAQLEPAFEGCSVGGGEWVNAARAKFGSSAKVDIHVRG